MDLVSQRAQDLKRTMECCVCHQLLGPHHVMLRCCQQILCGDCFRNLTSRPKRCPMCNLYADGDVGQWCVVLVHLLCSELKPPSLAHPDLFLSLNTLLEVIEMGRPAESIVIDPVMLKDVFPGLHHHLVDNADVYFSKKEVEFLSLLSELKRACAGHLVRDGRLDVTNFGVLVYRLMVSTSWTFGRVEEFATVCAKFGANRYFVRSAAPPEAYQLPAHIWKDRNESKNLILSWMKPFLPGRHEVVDGLGTAFGLQPLVGKATRHDWRNCNCVECAIKATLRNEKLHLERLGVNTD